MPPTSFRKVYHVVENSFSIEIAKLNAIKFNDRSFALFERRNSGLFTVYRAMRKKGQAGECFARDDSHVCADFARGEIGARAYLTGSIFFAKSFVRFSNCFYRRATNARGRQTQISMSLKRQTISSSDKEANPDSTGIRWWNSSPFRRPGRSVIRSSRGRNRENFRSRDTEVPAVEFL